MKKFFLTILYILAVCSCASIKETEIQPSRPVLLKPALSAITDSVAIKKVKSAIQSSPAALLANSMVYKDGKWSMALTKEEADSLGVPQSLYNQYKKQIEKLNK